MSAMRDRILKFMNHESITATRFADEIGVQRSSVSHILSGRNNPSFEFIQKILTRYKQVNAEWLILGIGSMIKKTEPGPPPRISQLDLFQKASEPDPSAEVHKSVSPKDRPEISASPKVEKIVLFYTDHTFQEFTPEPKM